MASRLNPYISFDGNAREAMEFYKDVFGGTLVVNTFGEFGGETGPGADRIMHAMLETDSGFTLMASDLAPGMPHTPGDNIAISLFGDSDDGLQAYWSKLADGGTVAIPMDKQSWGDEFGACKDRFGINWVVNVTGSEG